MRLLFQLLLPVAFALTLVSCDDAVLYEKNEDIKNGSWNMKQQLGFDFEVPDTTTRYNFYFNIRNTDEYPFSNIYVFFHTKFPNGKMGNDTIEFPLMDENTGQWKGKGQGDIHDCRLIFRQNARFPVAGKYHMDVEQAMRMEELPGIMNAGIRIEKIEH